MGCSGVDNQVAGGMGGMKKLCFLAMLAGSVCGAQTNLYVNPQSGADDNEGTASKPFASLEKARLAIRAMKKAAAFPAKGAVVELGGTFDLTGATLALDAEDSGLSASAPVVYRAARSGALLVGGHLLPAGGFRKVTDAATRARLPDGARDKVVAFDVKTVGLTSLPPLPDKFSGWGEMEVFSGGKAMRLARWPNSGWAEIAGVIDRGVRPVDKATGEWEFGDKGGTFEYDGDAPARWNVEKGIWMNGFWCHDWANETLRIGAIDKEKRQITSAAIHTYGIGNSSKWHKAKRRYFVFNLLEELDSPGEWYVDREEGVLYFFPPDGDLSAVVLSVQKKPLIQVTRASHIRLDGLTFKYSTGKAVSVDACENVVLENLRVSNLTLDGIGISGGKNCGLSRCEVSGVGGTGSR